MNAVSEKVVVGSKQVGVFPFGGGSVDVDFFDNVDQGCAGEVDGGPFRSQRRSRLTNAARAVRQPGDMQALALEI